MMTTAANVRGRGLLGTIRTIYETFDAARDCASAVESRRKPSRQSLRRLGINETAFDGVRQF